MSRKGRVTPDYWDRIQDMIRVGSRTTITLSEWANSVQQDLQIQGLDKFGCRSLVELVNWCDENASQLEALEFVDGNAPLIVALARKIVQDKKEDQTQLSAEKLVKAAKANGLWEEVEAQS